MSRERGPCASSAGRRRPAAPPRPSVAKGALRLSVLALVVLSSACAQLSGPQAKSAALPADRAGSAPAAARPQSDAGSASGALLAQSRAEQAAGDYGQATASVERALRIDPNNPALWLELGELELASGDPAQATTMARKALTLAAGDPDTEARAQRLLDAASR
jgi:tetratricopeptide (TPR) repeat protein